MKFYRYSLGAIAAAMCFSASIFAEDNADNYDTLDTTAQKSPASLVDPEDAAPADMDAPSQQSTSTVWNTLQKKFSAEVITWLTGPTGGALDGVQGPGSSLTLTNYAIIGYKFNDRVKLSFGEYWDNYVRSDSGGTRNMLFYNPYVTLSNSSITASKKYGTNLSGYIRYYIPVGRESADNVGKTNDVKNGLFRGKIGVTKTLMDGALTLDGAAFIYRALPGSTLNADTLANGKSSPGGIVTGQRDWYFWFFPKIAYTGSDKVQPYIGYSNIIEHYRDDPTHAGNGRWTSLNDQHALELGLDWYPVANIDINPYIDYGSGKKFFMQKEAQIGLLVDWTIL